LNFRRKRPQYKNTKFRAQFKKQLSELESWKPSFDIDTDSGLCSGAQDDLPDEFPHDDRRIDEIRPDKAARNPTVTELEEQVRRSNDVKVSGLEDQVRQLARMFLEFTEKNKKTEENKRATREESDSDSPAVRKRKKEGSPPARNIKRDTKAGAEQSKTREQLESELSRNNLLLFDILSELKSNKKKRRKRKQSEESVESTVSESPAVKKKKKEKKIKKSKKEKKRKKEKKEKKRKRDKSEESDGSEPSFVKKRKTQNTAAFTDQHYPYLSTPGVSTQYTDLVVNSIASSLEAQKWKDQATQYREMANSKEMYGVVRAGINQLIASPVPATQSPGLGKSRGSVIV
jgi:HPt (histidine-containing phosphotransfer) domain-containing protein